MPGVARCQVSVTIRKKKALSNFCIQKLANVRTNIVVLSVGYISSAVGSLL